MILLLKFGINQNSQIFQRLQIAFTLLAHAIWLAFEKFAWADLSQNTLANHVNLHKWKRMIFRSNEHGVGVLFEIISTISDQNWLHSVQLSLLMRGKFVNKKSHIVIADFCWFLKSSYWISDGIIL